MLEEAEEIGESGKERMAAELSPKSPNIFLKLGKEGTVLCANRAADALLEYWGIKKGEKVPQALRHSIKRVLAQEDPENLDIQAGKVTYAALLYPFPTENYVSLQGLDISFRVLTEEKLRKREKQYLSLSNLGRISLTCKNFQEILEESTLLIGKGLGVEFSRILELTPDKTFIVRAGYGWKEGPIYSSVIKENSQAEYTLVLKRPIILKDIETETRFECGELLRRYGIASGVTVLIGDVNKPFGVMEVYSREKREFSEDEIYFLNSAAFLLSEIIKRLHAEEKLSIHQQELEKLVEKKTLEYTEANEKLVHEVRERRRIENSLRNNLKFLETLLDTIPTPVFYKDSEGRYLGCNDILARQVLGLEKEEIIGRTFAEVYRKFSAETPLEIHQDDLELLQKGGNDVYEKEIMCADGIKRDFLANRVTFPDEEGKTRNMVAVLLDVTELRKTENKLQNNVRFLETLLDSIPSPVFQRDLNETYVNCNESFARQIMGLSKDEVIGGSFQEFQKRVPKELAEIYHKDDRSLIEKGGSNYYETKVVCADGVQRDFLFHKATYQDSSGKVAGVVGVMLDITQRKAAEKTFKISEERYRIAAEQTGQIVYDYNTKTEEVDWAGAIAELTGYSFEEFQKVSPEIWLEHIHPDDREKVREKVRLFFERGERLREEFRFRKKDGNYIYVEDRGVLLRNEEGSAYRMLGVMKDITKLKLAQEDLEKSEERYRIAAEQTGQIVYDYNRLTGKIEWAGAIKELTQYSLKEFQNLNRKAWETHIHTDDRKGIIEKLEEYRERGERFTTEYRFRKKDGSYLYVEDSGIFLKDAQGHSYRDIGVMKDITGMKLASKKLRESEERYRSFMKNFRGIAFQGSLDFTPILVEGIVEEITGYRGEDFTSGKVNWYQIVLPEDRQKLVNNNERLVNNPLLLIEHEYRIRHRNGKIKWVREIIQNVSDLTGKERILQGAVYDVTGQKEAEESLRKVEEIRKKEIHHRIKNNLQVISSLLELQAERFSEKEVLEAFRESQNRVATMAIIHEELYRSRNNETLDFSEYLQKLTADLLRSYTIRKGDIRMQLDIEETFLGMDTAVPLGIIINELVSNSLKHAFPQGRKGEIRIKLCRVEENGKNKSISNSTNNIGAKSSVDKSSQYSLVVSDNGLGFPENLDFRNTGSLGLQLVNILVEQLEGTIELQKGVETTFKILFKEND